MYFKFQKIPQITLDYIVKVSKHYCVNCFQTLTPTHVMINSVLHTHTHTNRNRNVMQLNANV